MRTDPVLPKAQGALEGVLRASIVHRGVVVAATVALAAWGVFNLTRLPIDAVPDVTTVQVQINTVVEGLPPLDIERQVTYPIETGMAGLPGLLETRSLSRYGLSQVTIVFRDGTDIYFARQLVNERLQEARAVLPAGTAQPVMGPIASGLGDIFLWEIEASPEARKPDGTPYTVTDLREIQDWVIRPQIRTVPGVTEVNTIGGYRKQFDIRPDPARLRAYGLTLADILRAVERNNQAVGAGFLPRKGEQYLVHTDGRLGSPADIEQIVIATRDGVPVHVAEVATVGPGQELRAGAATSHGRETVIGTAIMLFGENSRVVARNVGERLLAVSRSLPPGVTARPVYDRTHLVEATIETVRKNLLEGAVLVIAVLFAMLGNWTAALIVALVIPLSMLMAACGMVEGRISANLLSLGAIDFGIIVDASVVMVENIVRRLGAHQRELGRPLTAGERLAEGYAGAREVARPTLFGAVIILIVYLPVLALTGIEGRMFRPLAAVAVLALSASLVLAFTFVPAMTALLLRGRLSEIESVAVRRIRHAYLPVLRWSLRHRRTLIVATAGLLVLCGALATRLGGEFVPTLDEHDLLVQPLRLPGISVDQAVAMQHAVEASLLGMPEVRDVFGRLGTAEVANDPMPISIADTYVMLKPRREWPRPHKPRAELIAEVEQRLALLPGNAWEITQPIQMRFNELIAGVRGDLAIKVFGDDLDTLLATANHIARVVRAIPGASDVKVEQVAGLPTLAIDIDRRAVARYGLDLTDVQTVVRTALAGTEAGELFAGDRRFPIVVRLPEASRRDVAALEMLPIPVTAHARDLGGSESAGRVAFVPLSAVATIRLEEGPNQVSRENGKRRVVVQANVRGRDLASFVTEARRAINTSVRTPVGSWLGWGGQFENLVTARNRLLIVVPIALALILTLLVVTFGSLRDALVVFSGVPLALTGGVLALFVRQMPFSITAGIGFIALSGVAVLNGVVLLWFVRQRIADGVEVELALIDGCTRRLRPILMTALVAALGFVPMALATGTGAEVQRPLATVVIGGILSSTLLTLIVLPALYAATHRREAPLATGR
jgi:cobalt-zinc-cadmium resistance protein CzcA